MNKDAKKRLVKLFQVAESDDGLWEFADAILEETGGEDVVRTTSSHTNTGLYEELDDLAHEIIEDTGQWVTPGRLRHLRATADAWKPAERDPEVCFTVHERLRGSKEKLSTYKRRAIADYKRSPKMQGSPRLTVHRLANYRADEKPMVSWIEARTRTLRSVTAKATGLASLDELEVAFRNLLAERRKELGWMTAAEEWRVIWSNSPARRRKIPRAYELFCGNFKCPTRLALQMFTVPEEELPDGEVWYCPDCRS